jgi:hypothetical protein
MHGYANRFDGDLTRNVQEQATRIPPEWVTAAQRGAIVNDGVRQGMSRGASEENTYQAQSDAQISSQSSQINQGLVPLHLQYLNDLQSFTTQQGHELPGNAAVADLVARSGAQTPEDMARLMGMI